jgi:glycosyltransferase involved in cell wall biosynthesis
LKTGAKIIAHFHSYQNELLEPPVPVSVPGANAVIAVSRAVASLISHPRVHVVYPGVQTHRETCRPLKCASAVIGYAGRLAPIKGVRHLLRAFPAVLASAPDARLEIAGDGPERASLERESEALGISNAVRFLGWVEDIRPLLDRWDVYVHPALSEGAGIAILEAMAASLPVVATNVGGTPEIVQDAITGWLVPSGDMAAMGTRIRQLLSQPALRISMGAAARKRVEERFSATHMASEVRTIYEQVLAS